MKMLQHLIAKHHLDKEFQEHKLNEKDKTFIAELIDSKDPTKGWPYHGRGEEKSFLYEVNNCYSAWIHVFDCIASMNTMHACTN